MIAKAMLARSGFAGSSQSTGTSSAPHVNPAAVIVSSHDDQVIAEALHAATAGGARALRRDDVGFLAPGSRADLVVLDAPSYTHLVYRPGVPLVRTVIEGGVVHGVMP